MTFVADGVAGGSCRPGQVGDELVSLNGRQPRDVIEYQQLVDCRRVDIVVRRQGRSSPRWSGYQGGR